MHAFDVIRRSEFFAGLPEEAARRLAALAVFKTLSRGEHLFHEGQKGGGVFLLAEGRLQLVKAAADGRETVLKTVEPGQTFGEVTLFETDHFPVTARALGRCVVLRLSAAGLRRLLGDEAFRAEFLRLLFTRMRYLAERIVELTASDVETRFFRFLREQFGEREQYVQMPHKKDLAAAIATTPETISRLLDRLRRQKTATWMGRTLRLKAGFWKGHPA
jgi:CRP/FNR family transcriptional regulator, dissimilatory nitrate respiration regulator